MKDKEIIEKVIDDMRFTKRGIRNKRPNWLNDLTRRDIEDGIKKAMKLKTIALGGKGK